MTTLVVLADPPVEGVVGRSLVETTPLDAEEVVSLYEAMLSDVARAASAASGQLLVNYRPRDHLDLDADVSPKRRLESVVAEAVDDPEAVRYEVQVGSSHAARVGNTVTHLLEGEEEGSVHVIEPTVPLVTRQGIDSMSMKLRRSPVVLSPGPGGRVGYAGFSEPVDFDGAYEPPAVTSLVEAARAADLDADFVPSLQPVETAADLASVVSVVRARARADRIYPSRTYEWAETHGVYGVEGEDGLDVEKTDSD
ncbi:Uncharacterized protein HSBGL_1210 [Halapricum desulfuricans]|uniref:DUF2064 domain-containing protein n=1 Tax=Halapricum desulfuricans TaxID=2841257 RepID=A0A897NL09_9EURY|nr:hypothetical protein [Halapricum desulfuricans]QSG11633.1 Uncharacterized protein HSBGL_1210 [Halapricum desulfuricans]